MAYRHNFNPDALPAHVEPQQAAQMISQHQSQTSSSSVPTVGGQATEPSWKNKPPPPIPGSGQQPPQQSHSVSPRLDPQAYRRPSNPTSASPVYGQYPPQQQVPGAYPPQSQSTPPAGYGPQHHAQPGSYPPQQSAPGGYTSRPYSHSLSTSPRPPAQAYAGTGGSNSAVPQAGSDPGLFPIFRSVDTDGSGQLTEEELGRALKNGDYTSFDPETVKMMIKMFDHDRSGTIGFEEFCGLWGFLGAWRQLFDRFDEDRSGYISFGEYNNALVAFGYHLTSNFVTTLYNIYGRRRSGEMSFDLFVQSCISLKRMTDVFKRYDTDRDGFITLSFEEFLTEILNQR